MTLAPTVSGYIGRQFLLWVGAVYGTIIGIIFLLDFVELIRRASGKSEATIGLLLQMAALKLPNMAQEVLPFAILFGAMMTFWRLTRTNELVIARAAGMSVWQFLATPVLAAGLIGIVAVTVFNPVAATLLASYEALDNRILRGVANRSALFPTGLWLRESDYEGNHVLLHAERASPDETAIEGVTFFFFSGADSFAARMDAKEARLEPGRWRLFDGVRWRLDGSAEPFKTTTVPTQLTVEQIRDSFSTPETMSFWKLPGFIELLEQSGFSTQRHRLRFNVLLAKPLLLCAMVLIAATFSTRMQRRGGATVMAMIGVGAGFLLYFLSDVVYALGLSTRIPVELAAWAPAGVCLLLGTSLLLHLEEG
ncbi:MAG: LPS export ABC transporter permease LptG [Rhodospirillales bacterium]|nr:LPS export ABC transporter permease LptG [Rhodospirillales bacterium]